MDGELITFVFPYPFPFVIESCTDVSSSTGSKGS